MGLSEQIEEILKILSKSAAGDFDAARQLALAVQPQFKDQSRAKRKSIGRTKMMEIFLRDGFVDQYTGEKTLLSGNATGPRQAVADALRSTTTWPRVADWRVSLDLLAAVADGGALRSGFPGRP